MADLFISHAHEDKIYVRMLHTLLVQDGLTVFLDEKRPRIGEVLDKALQNEIQEARALLLIWSKASAASKYVRLEYEWALAFEKRIIPLRYDTTPWPESLKDLWWVSIGETQPEALLHAVRNQLQAPKSPQTTTEKGRRFLQIWRESYRHEFQHVFALGEYLHGESFVSPSFRFHERSRHQIPFEQRREVLARPVELESLSGIAPQAFLVTGTVGTGKTTYLRYLAFRSASAAEPVIPLFIKLREVTLTEKAIFEHLHALFLRRPAGDEGWRYFNEQYWEKGGAGLLLLCDGLDEVPESRRSAIYEELRQTVSELPQARIVATSRPLATLTPSPPFYFLHIEPFGPEKIEQYLNHFYRDDTDKISALKTQTQRKPHYSELMQTPLLLHLICRQFQRTENLSDELFVLYQQFTQLMLQEWPEQRGTHSVHFVDWQQRDRILQRLAFYLWVNELAELPETQTDAFWEKAKAEMALSGRQKALTTQAVLQDLCVSTGLLQESNSNYLFVHRLFAESYVARHLLATQEKSAGWFSRFAAKPDFKKYFDLSHWEEPLKLYASQLKTSTQCNAFLSSLWESNPALAIRCYPHLGAVDETNLLPNLLRQAISLEDRVKLIRSLPEKLKDQRRVVETLATWLPNEREGPVWYYGVKILSAIREGEDLLKDIFFSKGPGVADRYGELITIETEDKPFFMQANASYSGSPREQEVLLHRFEIGATPVTNKQYRAFCESIQACFPEWLEAQKRTIKPDIRYFLATDSYAPLQADEHPVVGITWFDAWLYAKWCGCRLPTEAEWEFACRAGTGTRWHFGDDELRLADYGHFVLNSKGSTQPVGQLRSNALGLYDMHGNVWEWCSDWYDNYQTGLQENPAGPKLGVYKVVRGGAWSEDAEQCQSGFRFYWPPMRAFDCVGFRLARS